MDLKDVIKSNREKAIEAHNAFHAGHHDVAENFLMEQMLKTCAYFDGKITLPEHVKQANDTSSHEDKLPATPAQAPGAEVPRPGVVPFQNPPKIHPASRLEKPDQ